MVNVGTGKAGSRFLKRDWPNEDSIIAGTTSQEGHKERLETQDSTKVTFDEERGVR